ncbi:MAG TPA: ribosome biogenesis GTP-binding protein YihA/YsxC [Burkholderiales bacterium]|nr:ribosome biogenesis GTP-binding protein YihA/YsxC [Burkholderiales bacterium]
MSLFRNAAFFKSAAELEHVPASAGEIAFAGRSNSGKSSAINALTGRRIAFVSKTPGRTRLINFYALGAERFIVDLPGYGYAKVPEAMRAPWEKLLGAYLQMRAPLRGLAVVMDVRHPLTELDRRLLGWFRPTGKPVHILLTKADKLSRAAAQKVLRRVEGEIAALGPNISVQLFSSLKNSGLEEAAAVFGTWLDASAPAPSAPAMKTPGMTRGREIKTPGL